MGAVSVGEQISDHKYLRGESYGGHFMLTLQHLYQGKTAILLGLTPGVGEPLLFSWIWGYGFLGRALSMLTTQTLQHFSRSGLYQLLTNRHGGMQGGELAVTHRTGRWLWGITARYWDVTSRGGAALSCVGEVDSWMEYLRISWGYV